MRPVVGSRLPAVLVGAAFLLVAGCGEESQSQPQYTLVDPTNSAPQCYAEVLPGLECAGVGPAPTAPDEVAAHISDSARPLLCEEDLVDLRAIDALFSGKSVFMMGEVHGSNEIGTLSARLFEQLVVESGVRTVAFEMPMDFQTAFQSYIDTGSDWEVEQILTYSADNMFINTLTSKAREMVDRGFPITIALIDAPYGTAVPIAAIQNAAQGLVTYRSLVLDSLPAPMAAAEYPTAQYVDEVIAYTDAVLADIGAICSELDARDCDTVTNMAHAMWTAVSMFDSMVDQELWFAVREEVIYYNLRQQLPDAGTKLYLHMGAFHTNKLEMSAGSRLAQEYDVTRGNVVSVAAAWGAGSQIWYQQVVTLEPSPPVVAQSLQGVAFNLHFVSTTLPGVDCMENPLRAAYDDTFFAPMGELYDGYFHIRQLTPETRPDDIILPLGIAKPAGLQVLRRWDRVQSIEYQVLGSHM